MYFSLCTISKKTNKLYFSDGRKRSMSLWVEFITASGYLSSRKIRSRFHSLMSSSIEKSRFSGLVELMPNQADVVLRINGLLHVRIIPAFRCGGMWPRSAQNWPRTEFWPNQQTVQQIKVSFNLTKYSVPSILFIFWLLTAIFCSITCTIR